MYRMLKYIAMGTIVAAIIVNTRVVLLFALFTACINSYAAIALMSEMIKVKTYGGKTNNAAKKMGRSIADAMMRVFILPLSPSVTSFS